MKNQLSIAVVISLTCFAGVLTGCEESVEPVLGTGESFTMYGFLNPSADTQAVRVYAIADLLAQETAEPLGAHVQSIDNLTGEVTVWEDSVVQYRNGTIGHVYFGVFKPEHNRTYRIEASGGDNTTSTVEVAVPPFSEPFVSNIFSTRANVHVEIDWLGAPQILETRIWYSILHTDGTDSTTVRVPISGPEAKRTDEGVLRVTILPSLDIGKVYSLLQLNPLVTPLQLQLVEVEAFVASANWTSPAPDGEFSPSVLVQPGVFDNVTNGFGFVGGGYLDTFVLELTDEQKEDAGYHVD